MIIALIRELALIFVATCTVPYIFLLFEIVAIIIIILKLLTCLSARRHISARQNLDDDVSFDFMLCSTQP